MRLTEKYKNPKNIVKKLMVTLTQEQYDDLIRYSNISTPRTLSGAVRELLSDNGIIRETPKDFGKKKNYYPAIKFPLPEGDIRKIADIVCRVYKIDIEKVFRQVRHKPIPEIRHVIRYMMKKHLKMSLKEIGYAICQADHSTAIHSIRNVEDWMETDASFASKIKLIDKIVKSRL